MTGGPEDTFQNNAACNNYILGGPEPINWAYITKSGVSQAPANPLATGTFSAPNLSAVNPDYNKDLLMRPGDRIRIHMHDTPAGFRVDMSDLTTGQNGSMTASRSSDSAPARLRPDPARTARSRRWRTGSGTSCTSPTQRPDPGARHSGVPYLEYTADTAPTPRGNTWSAASEVERCLDAVHALDDEDIADEARLGFLGHLSEAAATALARAVSFGRAAHDDLARMAGHLATDTATRSAAAKSVPAGPPPTGTRSCRAAPGRRGRPAASSVAFAEVTATVEASAATRAEVELSYHVPGASWRPLYDLALEGERLAVTYLAEVTQQTGEDWPAVELALSTTRRGSHQTLPELDPWYIGRAPPVPRRLAAGRSMVAAGAAPQQGAPVPLAGAAGADLEEAPMLAAEAGESGTGLAYRAARPLAVPADGGPHQTMIARFVLDAAHDHLAVPVAAPEGFLCSSQIDAAALPARHWHDGQSSRRTGPETNRPGQDLKLHPGPPIMFTRTARRSTARDRGHKNYSTIAFEVPKITAQNQARVNFTAQPAVLRHD